MERMRKAREGLELVREDLAGMARTGGGKEFLLAADRIGEALQHLDHAAMLLEDLAKEGRIDLGRRITDAT